MKTTTDLSEARKLIERELAIAEAATAGRWIAEEKHGRDTIWLDVESEATDGLELVNLSPRYIGCAGDQEHVQGQKDIAAIATAHTGYPAALRALLAVVQDIENCSHERDDDDHSGCPRCVNLMVALAAFVGAMEVRHGD